MERAKSMAYRRLLILPFLFWLVFFILGPFLLIFATSFAHRTEWGNVEYVFSLEAIHQLLDPIYLKILTRTLVMAAANTCITILIAYPIAFYLSRVSFREAMFWLTLFLIPFWTNYLIRLLAFMDILRLQLFGLEWTYSFQGILAALVYNYLPFAILPLYTALSKIPNSLLEASKDLGANKRKVFWHVLWPISKTATLSTSLLIFIPSLGEFLIPEIVGGGQSYYLGNFLQQQFLSTRNWPLGAASISIVLLLSLVLLRSNSELFLENS